MLRTTVLIALVGPSAERVYSGRVGSRWRVSEATRDSSPSGHWRMASQPWCPFLPAHVIVRGVRVPRHPAWVQEVHRHVPVMSRRIGLPVRVEIGADGAILAFTWRGICYPMLHTNEEPAPAGSLISAQRLLSKTIALSGFRGAVLCLERPDHQIIIRGLRGSTGMTRV